MPEVWTSLKLIHWTADFFEKKGIPNPRLDAELLLAHLLKCKRIDLYTAHEKKIPEKDLAKYKELIRRRAAREPLQYITGETEFWGLPIKVTPEVLIPRPETELLVEEALKVPGSKLILDIGTGSGCIAVALAKNLSDARIVATDISKEAIETARENAGLHGVADRIEFVLANIAPWRVFEAEGRRFDLIVSNPPYIPSDEFPNLQPEVRDFEPRKALDGGLDGLEVIRRILEEAPGFLRPGGLLLLEIGEGEADLLQNLKTETLLLQGFKKDYGGVERILILKKA
jgi:release factor glutamine methyltransferase